MAKQVEAQAAVETNQVESGRLLALKNAEGKFSGLWPAGWHDEMKKEWPE